MKQTKEDKLLKEIEYAKSKEGQERLRAKLGRDTLRQSESISLAQLCSEKGYCSRCSELYFGSSKE